MQSIELNISATFIQVAIVTPPRTSCAKCGEPLSEGPCNKTGAYEYCDICCWLLKRRWRSRRTPRPSAAELHAAGHPGHDELHWTDSEGRRRTSRDWEKRQVTEEIPPRVLRVQDWPELFY
jgi:hypothetical protein